MLNLVQVQKWSYELSRFFSRCLGRPGAPPFVFRLFLVAHGLGSMAIGAKLPLDGFFHGQDGIVKVPFGLAGFVGGGFVVHLQSFFPGASGRGRRVTVL